MKSEESGAISRFIGSQFLNCLIKWTEYLSILHITHYDVMVGWLVDWFLGKGKMGVCIGKK